MTSYVSPPGSEPAPTVGTSGAPAKRGPRISPRMILSVVILAIALWFIFANTRDMRIKLWVTDVTAPTWLVLLCTFAAGVIFGWLLTVRRRRRRR
jgi:uncharacterized integral membrane protein